MGVNHLFSLPLSLPRVTVMVSLLSLSQPVVSLGLHCFVFRRFSSSSLHLTSLFPVNDTLSTLAQHQFCFYFISIKDLALFIGSAPTNDRDLNDSTTKMIKKHVVLVVLSFVFVLLLLLRI